MTAPAEIIDLVERFARNLDSYRSDRYNETQVRREFIDPRFRIVEQADNATETPCAAEEETNEP